MHSTVIPLPAPLGPMIPQISPYLGGGEIGLQASTYAQLPRLSTLTTQ
jgi:hypothetical protein